MNQQEKALKSEDVVDFIQLLNSLKSETENVTFKKDLKVVKDYAVGLANTYFISIKGRKIGMCYRYEPDEFALVFYRFGGILDEMKFTKQYQIDNNKLIFEGCEKIFHLTRKILDEPDGVEIQTYANKIEKKFYMEKGSEHD